MNRQELRRKNRKKSKTYTLTSDQIATMTKEIEEKAYNTFNSEFNKLVKEQAKECTMQAFQQTFYIPLLVLRNMGWGKKRLTRFAEELINQYEMYEEKLYSSSDVKDMIRDETGIDIDFVLDFKDQKSKIKVVTD